MCILCDGTEKVSLRHENKIERNHCFEGTKQIGANFSNISEPPTRRQKVSAVFLNVIFINKERNETESHVSRSGLLRGEAMLFGKLAPSPKLSGIAEVVG